MFYFEIELASDLNLVTFSYIHKFYPLKYAD